MSRPSSFGEGFPMPTYEYMCDPCAMIYMVRHGMNEKPKIKCPKCNKSTPRVPSAPNLNMGGWSSPTEAKYSKLSISDELAKEKELQKTYETVWLPPPVVHNPWDEDDHDH